MSLTATQLEMQAVDLSTALGPSGLHTTIAGVDVTVTCRGGHVVVTDDRQAHHDFWGATWGEIVTSMRDYFGMVSEGS